MSGFVLAHNYEGRVSGPAQVIGFMRLRLVRLYPLYAIALVAGLVVHVGGSLWAGTFWPSRVIWSFLANLAFLPAPPAVNFNDQLYPYNTASWSLLFELFINLAFAVAMPFLSRRGLAMVIIAGAVAVALTAHHNGYLGGGWNYATWWAGVVRVTFSFFVGVAIHRLWKRGRLNFSLGPWSAVAVMTALFMVPASGIGIMLRDGAYVLVLLPLLVAASTAGKPSRLLGSLGGVSYALYVIHLPILHALDWIGTILLGQRVENLGLLAPLLLLSVSLPAAFVLNLADAPLRRWLNKVFINHREVALAPSEPDTVRSSADR